MRTRQEIEEDCNQDMYKRDHRLDSRKRLIIELLLDIREQNKGTVETLKQITEERKNRMVK